MPTVLREPLRQIEDETVGGLGRGGERVFGALALLVGDLPLLEPQCRAANRQARQARAQRSARPRGCRSGCSAAGSRRAGCRRQKPASSTVGSGAPRGREAIQRSASSSTGERSKRPLWIGRPPPSAALLRRYSVCCLIQPMSVCQRLGQLVGAGLKARPDHRRR